MTIFRDTKIPFPPAPNGPVKQERKAGSAKYNPRNYTKKVK